MTSHCANPLRYRAFTLIEMLAVVVLLGLMASVAVVSLVQADDSAALQSARWGVANLDARARLAARTQGCAMLLRGADGGSVLAAEPSSPAKGGWSTAFSLPRGTKLQLFSAAGISGQPLDALLIDRTGRSADVMFEITSEAGRSERWFLHGLTGPFIRLDVDGGDQ